jgi:hypothetical protein
MVLTTFFWSYGGQNVSFVSSAFSWRPISMENVVNNLQNFRISLDMKKGKHQYKFIVDDEWRHDMEKETINDGKGGKNNVIWIKDEECPICFSEVELHDIGCGHKYCSDCLTNYFNNRINQSAYKIRCPNQSECNLIIPYNKISYFINEEMLSALDRNKLKHVVYASGNLRFCPYCDCVCEKGDDLYFECHDCDKKFCHDCHDEYFGEGTHECGIDHILYELNGAIESDPDDEQHEIKRCPNCQILNHKYKGCDAVKCPYCRYRYCWNCLTLNKNLSDNHSNNCRNYGVFNDEDSPDPSDNEDG